MKTTQFFSNQAGSVSLFGVSIIGLIILITGITIDAGRIFTVKNSAQSAIDAALFAAVASFNSVDYKTEFVSVFNANFDNQSMGVQVTGLNVTESNGIMNGKVTLSVPGLFSQEHNTSFTVSGEVTFGFSTSSINGLELAIAVPGGHVPYKFGPALNKFVDDIFNNSNANKLSVSVVNYEQGVHLRQTDPNYFPALNAAPKVRDWLQTARKPYSKPTSDYTQIPSSIALTAREAHLMERCNGYVENNSNCQIQFPVPVGITDVSDEPPLSDRYRFSMTPIAQRGLWITGVLTPLTFAETNKTELKKTINALDLFSTVVTSSPGNEYYTVPRLNVGMLWAWLTLSPKWKGIWDTARPSLPVNYDNKDVKKTVVFITEDTLSPEIHAKFYQGTIMDLNSAINAAVYRDDVITKEICREMKSNKIEIYTILLAEDLGYGKSDKTKAAMKECASSNAHYFYVNNSNQLETTLKNIADKILTVTISYRLRK